MELLNIMCKLLFLQRSYSTHISNLEGLDFFFKCGWKSKRTLYLSKIYFLKSRLLSIEMSFKTADHLLNTYMVKVKAVGDLIPEC